MFALLFYVGAILVDDGIVGYSDFFTAMFSVIFGAFGIGQVHRHDTRWSYSVVTAEVLSVDLRRGLGFVDMDWIVKHDEGGGRGTIKLSCVSVCCY